MRICKSENKGQMQAKMLTRVFIITAVLWFCVCGCEPQAKSTAGKSNAAKQFEAYRPQTLEIIGLSGFKPAAGNDDSAKLTLFVKALDPFGSAVKSPCIFRVELYEYVEHSPSPLGKRLAIWPDIDLTDPAKNNAQWRDYLRAYEFNFDVGSKLVSGRVYIVEVTCLSPMEKRMSAQHNLKY